MSKLALDPVNIQYLSSAPVSPTINAGDMYFDTTLKALQVYSGSAWIKIDSKIYPTNSSSVGLTVQGAASQSADLQQWQDSSGTVLAKVDSGGQVYAQNGTIYGALVVSGNSSAGAYLTAYSGNSGFMAINARAAAGQTASIQEWQNSSGTVVAKIDANGNLTATNFSTTVTALDGGVSDSIAPYAGGRASTTSTQTINGGSA